ncbi:MAG: glycosyltransferase family 2 protein [Candidatus Roizmanbacteria bacterium]|nr:glycosyltransferase family 2 protein [Candidatus Roizmanbacteria bacterium]
MKQSGHFLSLIIPVYKQESTVVKNVQEIQKVLDTIRYDYEVLIVIDGLVDQSHELLKKAHIPKTRIIYFKKNQGKAFAIRTGMEKAKGDYIMFMDSGMEIDPNGISMLLEHMEWYNADIIVGSKRHQASQVQYSRQRKVLSYGYYYIVKLMFGIKVTDTQAGIKIFKKNVLKKILPKLVEKKFVGDLEMLVAAKSLGFDRIYEAPIKLSYAIGPLSSAATVQSIAGILLDTLAIWYRVFILKWYTK